MTGSLPSGGSRGGGKFGHGSPIQYGYRILPSYEEIHVRRWEHIIIIGPHTPIA